jgi:acetyltransferase-like isoleucine patch superfamily enzyme
MLNSIRYFLRKPLQLPINIISRLPYFKFIRETKDYQCQITFEFWFIQKFLNRGGNKRAYWPVHFTSTIVNPKNIYAGIDTCPGLMNGCYIQGIGKIYIGDYTQIGPQVIIISANHDLHDTRKHIPLEVKIGRYCWLGAGAKIMPGVTLGDFTIVAAGAIVTKSFPEGHCVIGGNTAKTLKNLKPEKCIRFENKIPYYGYLNQYEFEDYRKKHLNV